MTLLVLYILIALLFSFLCSIAEAVLLSVTKAHITLLQKEGRTAGFILDHLKSDINKPLSAILTLNTFAHTIGAVGAGAQAAILFGNHWVGMFSGLLTLAILVFSEIIPKTLGATYWRGLASVTAYSLKYLVWLLYPFVLLSEFLTRLIGVENEVEGFSRDEFAAMADLGEQEGQLHARESLILKNLFLLRKTCVTDAMTPRIVVFSLPESVTVGEYYDNHFDSRFSRIPVYKNDRERLTGFVLKDDLMLAHARGNTDKTLDNYRRELAAIPPDMPLSEAFELVLDRRAHIMMIVDEFGGMEGIITMEDIIETLLGLEIMDESDRHEDMQQYAKRMWRKRAMEMGIVLPDAD
jgi:CBS domain containing-hemolysin-like protein